MSTITRCAFAAVMIASIVACDGSSGGTDPTPRLAPNFIRIQSEPGEALGQGKTYEYTQANSRIEVFASGGRLGVGITGDDRWSGQLYLPAMLNLLPGTYRGLGDLSFSWAHGAFACSSQNGSVTIEQIEYSEGDLAAVDLRFEHYCEGIPAALRGTMHWRWDDTTTPPGPVLPIPANLWRLDASFVPPSGNYVRLVSDPTDYIGRGLVTTYTAPAAPIVLISATGSITIGAGPFTGTFTSMSGVNQLQTGYYANLQRVPFHNPARGGLDWSGDGRGCNTLSGWFAIDKITYSGTAVTALDLRFEQYCDGSAAAIRGAVHWTG